MIEDAINALKNGEQCDADGVMIKVSRQALHKVFEYIAEAEAKIAGYELCEVKEAARYRFLKANASIDWEPSNGIAMVIPEPPTGTNWEVDVDDAIDESIRVFLLEENPPVRQEDIR